LRFDVRGAVFREKLPSTQRTSIIIVNPIDALNISTRMNLRGGHDPRIRKFKYLVLARKYAHGKRIVYKMFLLNFIHVKRLMRYKSQTSRKNAKE